MDMYLPQNAALLQTHFSRHPDHFLQQFWKSSFLKVAFLQLHCLGCLNGLNSFRNFPFVVTLILRKSQKSQSARFDQ